MTEAESQQARQQIDAIASGVPWCGCGNGPILTGNLCEECWAEKIAVAQEYVLIMLREDHPRLREQANVLLEQVNHWQGQVAAALAGKEGRND